MLSSAREFRSRLAFVHPRVQGRGEGLLDKRIFVEERARLKGRAAPGALFNLFQAFSGSV